MLLVFVKPDLLRQLILAVIYNNPHETAFLDLLQELDMLSLSAPYHRCKYHKFCPLRELDYLIYHLIYGLAAYYLATLRAVRYSNPCK